MTCLFQKVIKLPLHVIANFANYTLLTITSKFIINYTQLLLQITLSLVKNNIIYSTNRIMIAEPCLKLLFCMFIKSVIISCVSTELYYHEQSWDRIKKGKYQKFNFLTSKTFFKGRSYLQWLPVPTTALCVICCELHRDARKEGDALHVYSGTEYVTIVVLSMNVSISITHLMKIF